MNDVLKETIEKIKAKQIREEAVYNLLCSYYDDYIEELDSREDAPYPEELTLPLEMRSSGIIEAMSWLITQKYDLDEGDCFNPLMMAVGHADAPMTSFLISNGANANYWPDMDEEPEYIRDNYYLEDIDIAYYNEAWPIDKRYVNALLQTARVLLEEGKTGSFYGLCLSADSDKREISLSSAQYLY